MIESDPQATLTVSLQRLAADLPEGEQPEKQWTFRYFTLREANELNRLVSRTQEQLAIHELHEAVANLADWLDQRLLLRKHGGQGSIADELAPVDIVDLGVSLQVRGMIGVDEKKASEQPAPDSPASSAASATDQASAVTVPDQGTSSASPAQAATEPAASDAAAEAASG